MVKVFGWWDIAAHFTGIVVGMVVNYSMNSLWAWQKLEYWKPGKAQHFIPKD
jgi:putative flippase GtrA